MSALTVRLDLSGFGTIEAVLARLNPLQSETLLEALARLIREQTVDRLISGGPAPDGSAWKPNAEWRTPILHRTGALARSIDYAVSGNAAIVGSGLVYAAIHQHGGAIKPRSAGALAFRIGNQFIMTRKVTMPARPYIGLSVEDRAELVAAAVGYLRRLFQ